MMAGMLMLLMMMTMAMMIRMTTMMMMMEKGKLMHPGLVALHANDSFQLANGLGNYDEAKRYAKMAHDALSIKYGKDNPRSMLYKKYLENKITGNMLIQQLSSIKISI